MGMLKPKGSTPSLPIKPTPVVRTSEEIQKGREEDWLLTLEDEDSSRLFCAVLGETSTADGTCDSTGKTGIVVDWIGKQLDINKEDKCYFIDCDKGLDNVKDNQKDKLDRFMANRPLTYVANDKGDLVVNYEASIRNLMNLVHWLWQNYRKHNIKHIVFDGLSTYKLWAEFQLKAERGVKIEDKLASTMYWRKRNATFLELIDLLAQIPVNIYMIGHDDFLREEKEIMMGGTPVKMGVLPKMLNTKLKQRIICRKEIVNDTLVLSAKITKAEGHPEKIGKSYEFMSFKDGKVKFDSSDVFEGL